LQKTKYEKEAVIKADKSLYCITSLNSALFLDVVESNCDLGLKNILSSSPGQRPRDGNYEEEIQNLYRGGLL
jgi:hypothetical protein